MKKRIIRIDVAPDLIVEVHLKKECDTNNLSNEELEYIKHIIESHDFNENDYDED